MTKIENDRITELNELFKTLNSNVALLNKNVVKVLGDYDYIRTRSTEDLLATGEILKGYQQEANELKDRAGKLVLVVDELIITVKANNILLAAVPCIDAVKKKVILDPKLPEEVMVRIEKITSKNSSSDLEQRR
jgi:hypothetical protein